MPLAEVCPVLAVAALFWVGLFTADCNSAPMSRTAWLLRSMCLTGLGGLWYARRVWPIFPLALVMAVVLCAAAAVIANAATQLWLRHPKPLKRSLARHAGAKSRPRQVPTGGASRAGPV
jgi:hypothetical protein